MIQQILHLTDIEVAPERQRKKFDEVKLLELQESIVTNGLLHPLVVRPISLSGGYRLVAGERRMRAIRAAHELGQPIRCAGVEVPVGTFPCVDIGELSEEQAYEAELEENIQRSDLSWQEKAAATARLMELRTLQADRTGAPKPTVSDITRELKDIPDDTPNSALGGYRAEVNSDLILSRHLDNPEVSKAKNPREAMKILKHQEQRERHAKRAKEVGATFSSKDHTLLRGDCLSVIETLPDASFDCLLTDPPYGMGANEFGDSGGRLLGQHHYDDSYESWSKLMAEFFSRIDRVMKPKAHAYIFCDLDRFWELKGHFMFLQSPWKVFRTPLIWINPRAMRAPWPEQGPQRKYQTCLYAVKGNRNVLRMAPDVVTFQSDENVGHAAQKPVDLLRDLLGRSCSAGDAVLDPFAGSGSIFPAAHEMKIRATGIEMDEASFGLASKRLEELK